MPILNQMMELMKMLLANLFEKLLVEHVFVINILELSHEMAVVFHPLSGIIYLLFFKLIKKNVKSK